MSLKVCHYRLIDTSSFDSPPFLLPFSVRHQLSVFRSPRVCGQRHRLGPLHSGARSDLLLLVSYDLQSKPKQQPLRRSRSKGG
jgi:hypothetical protein